MPFACVHRCVFLSGSSSRGWSHASSDRDFFVITDEPADFHATLVRHELSVEPSAMRVYVCFVAGVRWDVEFWLDTQVRQVIERCRPDDIEDALRRPLTRLELDLAYRILGGEALAGGGWLAAARSSLERSRLRSILINRALHSADALLDDTAGLLESGDLATATLTVRDAFDRVVDALLVSAGDLCPNPKWRARRLLATRPRAVSWDEYWATTTMRQYDPERPERWITGILDRCRELMMDIDAS